MANAINWFEIPASNYERAVEFYNKVLDANLQGHTMPNGDKLGFFPFDMENGAIGGCVIHGEGREPSDKGSLVYLNGGDDLAVPLGRVEAAGGKIEMPKTDIGENGFIAIFKDTEGNRVAFHSWH